jgi:hypothetical protein
MSKFSRKSTDKAPSKKQLKEFKEAEATLAAMPDSPTKMPMEVLKQIEKAVVDPKKERYDSIIKFATECKTASSVKTDMFGASKVCCAFLDTVYDGCPMFYFMITDKGDLIVSYDLSKEDNDVPERFCKDGKAPRGYFLSALVDQNRIKDIYGKSIKMIRLFEGDFNSAKKKAIISRDETTDDNAAVMACPGETTDADRKSVYVNSIGPKATMDLLWDEIPTDALYDASKIFKDN